MENTGKIFSADDLLHENLVMIDVEADCMENLLTQMCTYAQSLGFVKDSYLQAVLDREELYPTGLPTKIIKVALPHATDKSHVVKPGIFIAKLVHPVVFKEMGDGVNDIDVEMAFLLAVNGEKEQLAVLQDIVGMFTKDEALQTLKEACTKKQIIDIIKANI